MRGGATWNSRVNRTQVRGGVNLMQELLPVVIGFMLDHPELELGGNSYPVLPGVG